MNQIENLLKVIDLDWIKENAEEAYELMMLGKKELDNRKEVIETQREMLLMSRVLLEEYKDKLAKKPGGTGHAITVFGKEYESHNKLAEEFGVTNRQISHWKRLGVLEEKLQLKKEGKLYTGCGGGSGRKKCIEN